MTYALVLAVATQAAYVLHLRTRLRTARRAALCDVPAVNDPELDMLLFEYFAAPDRRISTT